MVDAEYVKMYEHIGKEMMDIREHRMSFERTKMFYSTLKGIILKNSNKSSKIIDVGCGWGYILNDLPKNTFGLDISKTLLSNLKNIVSTPLVCGDATRLPFKNNSTDVIICTDVLEHLHNPELCVSECSRVLKQDGTFIVNVPNGYNLIEAIYDFVREDGYEHVQRFSFRKIKTLLENYGFKIKNVTTLSLGFEYSEFVFKPGKLSSKILACDRKLAKAFPKISNFWILEVKKCQ